MRRLVAYSAPSWIAGTPAESVQPATRLADLAHLPTPIFAWDLPGLVPPRFQLWIKRDDYNGIEMSGNKVRKLQFLLADALESKCDSIVTVGGEQSNHVRATAMAARAVGMEPHVILRTDKRKHNLGNEGNIFLHRLAGSKIWLTTKETWRRHGSDALIKKVTKDLEREGRNVYPIPVGGTNGLGTWGYLDAVAELEAQVAHTDRDLPLFSDIALATGSGGTTGGIALGVHLSKLQAKVHGFSVCDSPDYFHEYIDRRVFSEINLSAKSSRDLVEIRDVSGHGYGKSSMPELALIQKVAQASGVVLDPCYTGKALFGLLNKMKECPDSFQGNDVLFWHTGGIFGAFEKEMEFAQLFHEDVREIDDLSF